MAYKMMLYAETHPFSLRTIPMAIVNRWFRYTKFFSITVGNSCRNTLECSSANWTLYQQSRLQLALWVENIMKNSYACKFPYDVFLYHEVSIFSDHKDIIYDFEKMTGIRTLNPFLEGRYLNRWANTALEMLTYSLKISFKSTSR